MLHDNDVMKIIDGVQSRKHPLYDTWANMKDRCLNPANPHYENYGGRGILPSPQWWKSFETFALDMGLKPTPKHTLERLDNNKGYCKENCAWQTRTEQGLNRRKFSNNTSGETGIHESSNRSSFVCKYDEDGKRFNLGRFPTMESALAYRLRFVALLATNEAEALKMTERRARLDSKTGIKGITQNQDGFLVRVTLLDGTRKYLGFSKSMEGAKFKLQEFVDNGGVFK